MPTLNPADLSGRNAYAPDGAKIGSIDQVYLDDQTGEPNWVSVNTGLFGTSTSLVPLEGATQNDSGDLQVAHHKDIVKDAPRVEADRHLSPDEEDELYRYYQSGGSASGDEDVVDRSGERESDAQAAPVAEAPRGEHGTDGHDGTSMTRSEERLNVGTQQVEAGRARLRKYVTTEEQTVTVPVKKETLRIEREPVEGESAAAGEISDEGEHVEEIVLREERPVVTKETVAVENVKVGKDVTTEDHTVTEQVRKEQVELEGDGVDTEDARGTSQR